MQQEVNRSASNDPEAVKAFCLGYWSARQRWPVCPGKRASSVPRRYVYLYLVILILAVASVARAGPAPRPAGEERVPNFLGATGLLLIPSAYVQRNRQADAGRSCASPLPVTA